jgi:hypothetical protein
VRRLALALALLALACVSSPASPSEARVPGAHGLTSVAPAEVKREIEALVCMMTIELPSGPIEEPIFGSREHCKLPPSSTPLERAVEQAWTEAKPLLTAMRYAWRDAVIGALAETDPERRLAAVRRAYLSARFSGILIAHLEPALAKEGLRCDGCPARFVPTPRTVVWDELAPYLAGYVWPEDVETPRDANGVATGAPEYALRICIGARGIDEIEDPDPALLELGFLVVLHNETLIDRAVELFRSLLAEPAFARLNDDFLRSRWLRGELGPRLLAEPEIRTATCDAAAKFVADTGVSIAECATWTNAARR